MTDAPSARGTPQAAISNAYRCIVCDHAEPHARILDRHLWQSHRLRENWLGIFSEPQWKILKANASAGTSTFSPQWTYALAVFACLFWVVLGPSAYLRWFHPDRPQVPTAHLWPITGPETVLGWAYLQLPISAQRILDEWHQRSTTLSLLEELLVRKIPPLAIFAAVGASWRARARRTQRRRDEIARRIASTRRGDPRPPFAFYLRNFTLTNRLRLSYDILEWQRGEAAGARDMETLLAEAIEPLFPLVALGRPGETVGAGRLATADDSWLETFQDLAGTASLLFLIPAGSAGVLEEITRIVCNEELIKKTIFIMPPAGRNPWRFRARRIAWDAAREAALGVGVVLPAYHRKGMIFGYARDLSRPAISFLPRRLSPDRFRRAIEHLAAPRFAIRQSA